MLLLLLQERFKWNVFDANWKVDSVISNDKLLIVAGELRVHWFQHKFGRKVNLDKKII